MPWFPEFASAAELARQQTRAAGHADPVQQYLAALNDGDARDLETTWPGEVVIYDPRAGQVRGHRHVRQFVRRNLSWQADLHARTEVVASTVVVGRYLAGLAAGDTDAVVGTFAPDGYFRGPFGPRYAHRGTAEAPA